MKTDRFFDPHRAPASQSVRGVVCEIINEVQNYEEVFYERKRARKKADQQTFEDTISAIICDLIHRYSENPSGRVALSLSNKILGRKSRYRPPALGKRLPHILKLLCSPEMSFVEMEKGGREPDWDENDVVFYRGKLTVITPGERLLTRIKKHNLAFADLGRRDDEEIIILKGPKSGYGDKAKQIEYGDTTSTHRYRSELKSINNWLASADLEIKPPFSTGVDVHNRRLRRIFNNGKFSEGGRLFGGFWMSLRKQDRFQAITIEKRPIVELDYGQMAIRQLYGMAKEQPPAGDLYNVPGLDSRDGIKILVNAALHASKKLNRLPQGTRKHFPSQQKCTDVLNLIEAYHPKIARYFYRRIGMELMFQESEILLLVMKNAMKEGHVVLPIHDAVLTADRSAERVKRIMTKAFKDTTGADAVVTTHP